MTLWSSLQILYRLPVQSLKKHKFASSPKVCALLTSGPLAITTCIASLSSSILGPIPMASWGWCQRYLFYARSQAVCPQPTSRRCTKDAHLRTQDVLLAAQSSSDAGSCAASARQAATLPLARRCRFARFADQPAVRVFAGVEVLIPEAVTHLQSVAGAAEVLERSFGCPAAVWRDGLARLAAQRVSVATAEAVRPKPITGFLGMALAACEGLCC